MEYLITYALRHVRREDNQSINHRIYGPPAHDPRVGPK